LAAASAILAEASGDLGKRLSAILESGYHAPRFLCSLCVPVGDGADLTKTCQDGGGSG
jgi:hypothetical protein